MNNRRYVAAAKTPQPPRPSSRRVLGLALAVLVLLATNGVWAQSIYPRFNLLSQEEGLSQKTVNAILQDEHGRMWFGTADGLNLYDGQKVRIFKSNPDDETTLSHSEVWALSEDGSGSLFVGTNSGLNRLRADERSFDRFSPSDGLPHEQVRVLEPAERGGLWVGTDGGGIVWFDSVTGSFTPPDVAADSPLRTGRIRAIEPLPGGEMLVGVLDVGILRYDPASGDVRLIAHEPGEDEGPLSNRIYQVLSDRQGLIWISTYDSGLSRFDPDEETWLHFRHDPKQPSSLSSNLVRDVLQDRSGVVWVATREGGLNKLGANGEFEHYRLDLGDAKSLPSDQLTRLYQDEGGVLWVGSSDSGLAFWNPEIFAFRSYRPRAGDETSLSPEGVNGIAVDSRNTLWIATDGGGLNAVDQKTGEVRRYVHRPNDATSLSNDRLPSILVDRQDRVWVGTFGAGISRLDQTTGRFEHFRNSDDPASLSGDLVMSIYQDRGGDIWIGTFRSGLNRYVEESASFERFRHREDDSSSLPGHGVLSLHQDRQGLLWVGTFQNGLASLDIETRRFTSYRNRPEDARSLAASRIYSILETENGDLWLGTQEAGLNRWRSEDRRAGAAVFDRITESKGLPNNVVYGLLADESERLWLSTNNGLSRFDIATGQVTTYSTLHGLLANEFTFNAYHRGPDGRMFFGGAKGVNAFFPEEIRSNQNPPPITVTSFRRNDRRETLLRADGAYQPVRLGFRDHVVSFDFAALDFTAPSRNRFRYRLDGYDEKWIDLGAISRVSLTTLPPGHYTLLVQAANSDGYWNREGLAIPLDVVPPPWKTWWVYSIYAIILLSLFWLYVRAQSARLRREEEYSRKLEEEVAARTKELRHANHELGTAMERLELASVTDALTGLKNRHYLLAHIEPELRKEVPLDLDHPGQRRRHDTDSYQLLMIDLDGFKILNDTYGHAAGDAALIQVGEMLMRLVREHDTVIRWGGDEFMVMARKVDRAGVHVLAERIRAAICEHSFEIGEDRTHRLGCSIGCALFPFIAERPNAISIEQTFALADRALYFAKDNGKNAWVAFLATESTPARFSAEVSDQELVAMLKKQELELATSLEVEDWTRPKVSDETSSVLEPA